MKILPQRTLPPHVKIDRRHNPRKVLSRFGYRAFRACLRWEFGFTCAFCLLHESDFTEHGGEGLGFMGIEHFLPVSADPGQVSSYDNCFYCCRLCNEARSKAPVVNPFGSKLLNPCAHVWGMHFFSSTDNLLPVAADSEAVYTAWAYDLNDPRRRSMRRARRERLDECLSMLEDGPGLIASTLTACQRAGTRQEAAALVLVADRLHKEILRALREVQRYAAIPRDAGRSCRCGTADDHLLPIWLETQTLEIEI
jgi:hypothetical protein